MISDMCDLRKIQEIVLAITSQNIVRTINSIVIPEKIFKCLTNRHFCSNVTWKKIHIWDITLVYNEILPDDMMIIVKSDGSIKMIKIKYNNE